MDRMGGPEGRLSNHQLFCLGSWNSPHPAEPDPGPIDVVVGALPEILAAEIPDGVGGALDTFRKTRVEAGEFTRLGNHFIWAIFKEKHRFTPVIFSGCSAQGRQALLENNVVPGGAFRKEKALGSKMVAHEGARMLLLMKYSEGARMIVPNGTKAFAFLLRRRANDEKAKL